MNETTTQATTAAPPSFDELCAARAAAIDLHRAALESLLPDLRARLIAGCLQRAQPMAVEKFYAAVLALDVLPVVQSDLERAGVPLGVLGDYASEVLFGSNGTTPSAPTNELIESVCDDAGFLQVQVLKGRCDGLSAQQRAAIAEAIARADAEILVAITVMESAVPSTGKTLDN